MMVCFVFLSLLVLKSLNELCSCEFLCFADAFEGDACLSSGISGIISRTAVFSALLLPVCFFLCCTQTNTLAGLGCWRPDCCVVIIVNATAPDAEALLLL